MAEAEKTEKITLNLSLIDLGQIDLLVQEGFYANRTDFLRTAARAQLAVHAEALQRTVERKTIVLGLESYTRQQLEDDWAPWIEARNTAPLLGADLPPDDLP